ncbi:hypothetical protein O1Q96_05065 [Streptomyces sp. Qhu-G9]|uniref:hypothetical protein n=1 Tax=Streptomyces sp. Qhu-G9 TaxID=3452799 RepID=UPI0022AC3675|nr:hypothetical protein [Streptomyces aurantiacus]WAU79178.1 hypothetical protein O1Q96_05065 [Streptomyces aurantiacus]
MNVHAVRGDAVRRHKETVITATSKSPAARKRPVIRRTLAAVGCTTVLAAGTAACGTVENLTAGQKVDQAFEGLGEKKSLAFEFGLDAKPSALTKLAGAAEPGDEMPPELAELFTQAKVKVSVESRKPLADSGEKDLVGTGVAISGPDGVLAEYRLVGNYTYYRADMKAVGDAMGFPVPSADELPKGEEQFKQVLEGKWVKVDNRELDRAAKDASGSDKADGGSAAAGGSDEIDTKTQQKILKAVRSVVAREVTFSNKGGSDGVERIVAKASFRDLLTGVMDKLRPFADDLPTGTELPTDKDLKDAPDKKVAVDFSLKNGDLTRISVDLAALAEDAKGARLPLVIKFGEADDISAPSGATKMPADEFGGPGNPFTSGLLSGF